MADTNTIIGESILVKGNLEGDEDLTIQGRVEGAINLSKTLIIEPSGIVRAEGNVANAIISGVMVGNLTASDSVELTDTGRMVGDIQAPRVIINEGALFKGQVDMGNLEMPRPASSTTSSYRPRTEPKPAARPAARPEPVVELKPAAKPEPKPQPKPIAKPKPVPTRKPVKVVANRGKKKKVVVKKKRR